MVKLVEDRVGKMSKNTQVLPEKLSCPVLTEEISKWKFQNWGAAHKCLCGPFYGICVYCKD